MQVSLLTLGKGLKGPTHMHGALFFGERALYFLCTYVGRMNYGKLSDFGPIGAALEQYRSTGVLPAIDESELAALVATTPHSVALAPGKIEMLSRSMWTGSKIVCDGGEKLVVWNPGFAGKLRTKASEWAARNGVKTKGL